MCNEFARLFLGCRVAAEEAYTSGLQPLNALVLVNGLFAVRVVVGLVSAAGVIKIARGKLARLGVLEAGKPCHPIFLPHRIGKVDEIRSPRQRRNKVDLRRLYSQTKFQTPQ